MVGLGHLGNSPRITVVEAVRSLSSKLVIDSLMKYYPNSPHHQEIILQFHRRHLMKKSLDRHHSQLGESVFNKEDIEDSSLDFIGAGSYYFVILVTSGSQYHYLHQIYRLHLHGLCSRLS